MVGWLPITYIGTHRAVSIGTARARRLDTIRDRILTALYDANSGAIARHICNIEIMLQAHSGVAEHPDMMATIEAELDKVAELDDRLEVLTNWLGYEPTEDGSGPDGDGGVPVPLRRAS